MNSIEKTAVIHILCDMGVEANNKGDRQEAINLSNAISGLIKFWRSKK